MEQNKWKVSGTGWLCMWSEKLHDWIPVVQLTPAQISEINVATERLT